jgi:hypothetical protein
MIGRNENKGVRQGFLLWLGWSGQGGFLEEVSSSSSMHDELQRNGAQRPGVGWRNRRCSGEEGGGSNSIGRQRMF